MCQLECCSMINGIKESGLMNQGIFRAFTACAFLSVAASCSSTVTPNRDTGPHDVKASPPGKAQCFGPNSAEQAMGVQATNRARSSAGLPSVKADGALARAAAAHACDMAERGIMTHTGSSTSGPSARVKKLGYAPRVTAENIAAGPYSAAQAFAAWNGSSGHLQNILIPQMRDFGVGSAVGSDGKTVYWAAVYAARR
ncbi:CAP domain-containing protein [Paracoccus sp. TK19116]|uniref:CAP domain-containing protein n=1 Tax=Paracoccus albicereus TaxID=2922394 RepID=A0ABT1MUR1_9RHOB|nr:CAP domain-containing protein [Paracoccus albicereus]MCQ0972089.1 CAP domain-containing protein [Paracoccus albicereus]